MPKLADYYVQVIPSMKGVKNSLESQLSGAATEAGGTAGGKFGTAFSSGLKTVATGAAKVTAAAITAASTGVAALTKAAVSSYSEYEQLVGGVQTLFTPTESMSEFVTKMGEIGVSAEEAAQRYYAGSEKVMSDANNAWKTAGMSANEYMETVTSFSASLVSSLGGDTEEAASYAKMAITDMSDNANKMGTSIESIENAYQGFAKQNYTMLDNLKLGYGGTKSEMERLIEDADNLSDSFTAQRDEAGNLTMSYSDIVDAIHIVQEEMGIAGTTAEEATSTISGSFGMLKASWSNLVTGLADENANLDELTNNVIESLVGITDEETGEKIQKGFLDNIIPVVETALSSIGDLITKLMPNILDLLPTLINDVLPDVIAAGTSLVQGLVTSMSDNSDTIKSVITQLENSIVSMLPDIISLGGEVVGTLASAISDNLDKILEAAGQILEMILTGITQNAESLVNGAVLIITKLVNFFAENADLIMEASVAIYEALISGIANNLDKIIEAGINLAMAIFDGYMEAIPELLEYIPDMVATIAQKLVDSAPDILEAATTMFLELVKALPDILVDLVNAVEGILMAIVDLMTGDGSSEFAEAALTMFLEIVAAVPEILGALIGAIGDLLIACVNAFNAYVSNMYEAGKELWGKIKDALSEVAEEIVDSVKEKVQSWADAISDKVEDFKAIGQNLITGLWNGISDKAEWLYSKITGMGSTIVNKVKSLFGVASPSKVFAEIGGYLAEGLEVGWSNEIDNVQKEINSDLDFSASVSMSKDYDTKASDQELGTFVIHDYISLDGTNMQEKIATYTIQKIGNETRAVKVAQGGYYGI
jgi:phage-related protein